jgi:hypothetical protein
MSGRMKIYCHGGHVVSQRDGQRHFVSAIVVARLHKLRAGPGVFFIGGKGVPRGHRCDENCKHIYPNYQGHYPDLSALQEGEE